MIADCDTNVVFVADTLEPRFPEIYRGLKSILTEHGIPLRTIPGTRDIWCRDYLPVQVAEDRFIQFHYAPDYLTGKYRHLRADGEIGPTLPWVRNCVRSEIVLDGGNIVKWQDKAILTDKIYKENPEIGRGRLREQLKGLLRVRTLLVIPQEPDDPIGHIDGMVRWLDDGSVAINDYQGINNRFRSQLLQHLNRSSLDFLEIPYCPQENSRDGIPSAEGNWVNFLRVRRVDSRADLRSGHGSRHPEAAPRAVPESGRQGARLQGACQGGRSSQLRELCDPSKRLAPSSY